jgi:hypothetical protein
MKKPFIILACLAVLAAALTLAASGGASSETPCGAVSFITGKATVTHKGKVTELDIDSPIYNNDMIKTQDKSKVEIEVDKSTGFSGKVTVAAKTVFYFKTSEVKGQANTTLDLMSGQIGMKVSKLAGAPSAQVRTDSAVCGVRGTEFAVTSAPSGDVLVTCDEGLVGLLGVDGDEAEAGPGKALQRKLGQRFQEMPVAVSSLEEFREKWYADQIQALRANPVKAIRQFSEFYQRKKADFISSSSLLEKSLVLKRWMEEDATPGFKPDPKAAQTLRDLKEMDGPILAIRKDLVMFERYYYRLEELKDIVKDTQHWNAELGKDSKGNPVTVQAFYKVFDAERDSLARRMALCRYAELLHAKRNPSGSTGRPSTTGDDGDFFGDEADDSFFDD